MTKEQKRKYREPELLRDILKRILAGRKFQLDCGHYVSFGHHLGNDITIINGKELSISASIVLDGEYDENDVAMGIPVKINQNGISEIQTIELDESESAKLKESAKKIRDDINSV